MRQTAVNGIGAKTSGGLQACPVPSPPPTAAPHAQPTAKPKTTYDIVVEMAEVAHKLADGADKVIKRVTKSAAIRAFRRLEVEAPAKTMVGRARQTLKSLEELPKPALNAAGDLRGMVVSRRARAVYDFTFKLGEKAEPVAKRLALIGIVLELAKDEGKLEEVWKQNLSTSERVRQTDLIVSTAILRAFTSMVPATVHLATLSAEGWLQLGGLATGDAAKYEQWINQLKAIDVKVQTTHDRVMDSHYIDTEGQQLIGDFANWVSVHVSH